MPKRILEQSEEELDGALELQVLLKATMRNLVALFRLHGEHHFTDEQLNELPKFWKYIRHFYAISPAASNKVVKEPPKDKAIKRINHEGLEVLEYWNSKEGVTHHRIEKNQTTKAIKQIIPKVLDGTFYTTLFDTAALSTVKRTYLQSYTVDDIKLSIDNFVRAKTDIAYVPQNKNSLSKTLPLFFYNHDRVIAGQKLMLISPFLWFVQNTPKLIDGESSYTLSTEDTERCASFLRIAKTWYPPRDELAYGYGKKLLKYLDMMELLKKEPLEKTTPPAGLTLAFLCRETYAMLLKRQDIPGMLTEYINKISAPWCIDNVRDHLLQTQQVRRKKKTAGGFFV